MGKIFDKTLGKISYEIVDEISYDHYWWGRRPSIRKALEEWIEDPDKTQRQVEEEHGKKYRSISLKMIQLMKLGIIRRFKREY